MFPSSFPILHWLTSAINPTSEILKFISSSLFLLSSDLITSDLKPFITASLLSHLFSQPTSPHLPYSCCTYSSKTKIYVHQCPALKHSIAPRCLTKTKTQPPFVLVGVTEHNLFFICIIQWVSKLAVHECFSTWGQDLSPRVRFNWSRVEPVPQFFLNLPR